MEYNTYNLKENNVYASSKRKKRAADFWYAYSLVSGNKTTAAEAEMFSRALQKSEITLKDVCSAIADNYYMQKDSVEGASIGVITMNTSTLIDVDVNNIAIEISKLDFVERIYLFSQDREFEFWVIVTEKNMENRQKIFEIACRHKNITPIVLTGKQLDEGNMPSYDMCYI